MSLPALILAGGKGKRLQDFTEHVPKPLCPLPRCGTLLDNIIANLEEARVESIYISVSHLGGVIEKYLRKRIGRLKCKIVFDQPGTRSPVDAIMQVQSVVDSDLLTIHADHFFWKNPFPALLKLHRLGEITQLIEFPIPTKSSGYDIRCNFEPESREVNYASSAADGKPAHSGHMARIVDGCQILPKEIASVISGARSAGEEMPGMRELFLYASTNSRLKMRGVALDGWWENINDYEALGRTARRIIEEDD